jgi:hypothetical protein
LKTTKAKLNRTTEARIIFSDFRKVFASLISAYLSKLN